MNFDNFKNELDSLTDRKNKSAIISLRVTPELKQDLQEYAKRKGLTLSDVFLKALSSQIDRENLAMEFKLKELKGKDEQKQIEVSMVNHTQKALNRL